MQSYQLKGCEQSHIYDLKSTQRLPLDVKVNIPVSYQNQVKGSLAVP